ncbi:hypothetical protein SFC81_11995 [Enterococcus faecalis]
MLIGVTGPLRKRSYQNKEGNQVYVTEILVETYQQMEFLPKEQADTEGKEQPVKQSNLQNRLADDDPFASISRPINFNDEDLPF